MRGARPAVPWAFLQMAKVLWLVVVLPRYVGDPHSSGSLRNAPADDTNLYLAASFPGVTAKISVYEPVAAALNINGPATTLGVTSSTPGAFSLPHGLSAAPSRIEILMISAGAIWAQSPAFDGANVYLEASDTGVTAKILVYA